MYSTNYLLIAPLVLVLLLWIAHKSYKSKYLNVTGIAVFAASILCIYLFFGIKNSSIFGGNSNWLAFVLQIVCLVFALISFIFFFGILGKLSAESAEEKKRMILKLLEENGEMSPCQIERKLQERFGRRNVTDHLLDQLKKSDDVVSRLGWPNPIRPQKVHLYSLKYPPHTSGIWE
jgi:hypothetical protein